ncbi:IS1380 family transposase [Paenibacillus sp. YYML68]|uniref:IS1380 family transposase n=1 Tax=Paenibacillus sp. YYML68 TaxID=2909250 RepID=UPI0037CCB4B0
MKFEFVQSNEYLTTHTGLTAIGALLAKTNLGARLNKTVLPENPNPDISNADVMKSYLGLLCQGKSDFDHIEPFRQDDAFSISLDIRDVPSSPTLRQRLDMAGSSIWKDIVLEESADLLRRVAAPLTGVDLLVLGEKERTTLLPLDIDVSPFDNSRTKKEGVSRTYKGHDGFAPIFSYLGKEGYGVHVELREGSVHCQKNTDEFLKASIQYARRVTDRPLLVRMDAGNDCLANLKVCHTQETRADYIIKKNLRRDPKETWLLFAQDLGICCEEREGKKVYIGSMLIREQGFDEPLRQVFRVIERTISREGQIFLVPEIEVEVYWTSLRCSAWRVIELYRDHGTSEQYHSEIKTDLDLERLPAGKFATNNLILHAGVFAYNMLRLMGQLSLQIPDSPIRNNVGRRRIRTVIQNMIYHASRLVRHARQVKFAFGTHSPWFQTLRRVYLTILTT